MRKLPQATFVLVLLSALGLTACGDMQDEAIYEFHDGMLVIVNPEATAAMTQIDPPTTADDEEEEGRRHNKRNEPPVQR